MGSARWSEEQLAEYRAAAAAVLRAAVGVKPAMRERGFWPVVPTPWVRESNRDKFDPRPRVQRYRAFRQECSYRKVWAPTPGDLVIFLMPIPKSWSKTKKAAMNGQPHEQVPDVDNLAKALLDACYSNDAHIWAIVPVKLWSDTPGIYIERREPAIELPFVEHIELAGNS